MKETDWTKTCYVTGEEIPEGDMVRFTQEFDAWVSEAGQEIVERVATGENPWEECIIIYKEWYAQDQEAASRDDADLNNEEFRQWHK